MVLALIVSQIIPVSQGAILLLVVGALLIGAELYTGSFVLGVGGLIAIVIGAVYLVDVSQAPGLYVALEFVIPLAIFFGAFLLFVATKIVQVMRQKAVTGRSALIGLRGKAVENVGSTGRVFVNGEYWNAFVKEGIVAKDSAVEVVDVKDGLVVEVIKVDK